MKKILMLIIIISIFEFNSNVQAATECSTKVARGSCTYQWVTTSGDKLNVVVNIKDYNVISVPGIEITKPGNFQSKYNFQLGALNIDNLIVNKSAKNVCNDKLKLQYVSGSAGRTGSTQDQKFISASASCSASCWEITLTASNFECENTTSGSGTGKTIKKQCKYEIDGQDATLTLYSDGTTAVVGSNDSMANELNNHIKSDKPCPDKIYHNITYGNHSLALTSPGGCNNLVAGVSCSEVQLKGSINNQNSGNSGSSEGKPIDSTCKGIIGKAQEDFIRTIMGYIQILAPLLLIVMCASDMVRAVMASDEKKMKEAYVKSAKRIIAAICVFLIPIFVKILLNLPGIKGALQKSGVVDSPLCYGGSK